MRIWIYRPDKEAMERRVNKDFVYTGKGKSYWDCFDEGKEIKNEIKRLKEINYKELCRTKIEVA